MSYLLCLSPRPEEVRHDDVKHFGMLLIRNVQWESPYKSRVHKLRVASNFFLVPYSKIKYT